jgi:exodeoxyribonuclease VII large subunit
MKENKKIFTVSELTKDIRLALEESFSGIWIEGEISNFSKSSSGHIYFSLKDQGALLKCAFFRFVNQKLKFEISDGMQVVCFGKISVYDKSGQYQLYVETIEPKGAGALQKGAELLL